MEARVIKKDAVKPLLLAASGEWEVYLPLEEIGGDVQFSRLEAGDDLKRLKIDYQRMIVPPKVVGFPQLQCLFEFRDGEIPSPSPPPSRRLLFGIRACDLRGIRFADEFFRRDFEDAPYLSAARNRLSVVVGCTRPASSCFCTSAGTGPFLEKDFDLQMIDLGEEYLVETGSEAGDDFIRTRQEFFTEAGEAASRSAQKEKLRVAEAVTLRVDFQGAIEKLVGGEVPRENLERIAERCIHCGGCLYVCPTCTCFNVFDDSKDGAGGRFRNWDACVFSGYTREAGGHNPRSEKWLRAARRYEHKLKYDYLKTGLSGCVGCGRCLDSCPVEIGIAKFIQEITGNERLM